MRDALLTVAVSLPALAGLAVLALAVWVGLGFVVGGVLGRMISYGERPYDQERDC